jgi:hypothetical protein
MFRSLKLRADSTAKLALNFLAIVTGRAYNRGGTRIEAFSSIVCFSARLITTFPGTV